VEKKNESNEKPSAAAGNLYVVGTPIGNLEDITLRALRVLREVDLIAAEDTRHTRKLLSHYDIHSPLTSYHEHNKRSKTPQLVAKLKEGADIALVSDAGMPGISDPGHDLIVSALEGGITVTVVPGPSALLSALVISGLPTGEFTFLGFPPRKSGERKKYLERALALVTTVVFFESPNRLPGLLEVIARLAPARKIVVARELTKKFEEALRGNAAGLFAHFEEQPPRGECVVLMEGSSEPPKVARPLECPSPAALVHQLMQEGGLSKKEAMRETAKRLKISRREVYGALLEE